MIYIPDKIESETKFCHYTTQENAANILNAGTIYLSRLDLMNDQDEKDLHKDELNQIFIASFCHSESRSIPMFYLYSGINGKGCRIQFTDSKIKNILQNSCICPVNGALKTLRKTFKEADYDLYAGWVNYIANTGYYEYRGKYQEKFSDFRAALQDMEKLNRKYLVKNPIWKYENEFRIVVRFKKPVDFKRVALKFEIKDKEQGISIVTGPEITQTELHNIKDEFADYGIRKIEPFGDKHISMGLMNKLRKR